MLTEDARAELVKQGYRIVGSHSAVKTCGWTKNMIRGIGGCYKLKFYGIMSNQCMQMTTSISCANRCTFCWRGYKAPVSKEWNWGVDDPDMILKDSIEEHHDLLVGFKGSKKANRPLYDKSREVRHVALSLTGEPIIYPRINELIQKFHESKISTFLVTNAQYPEQIKNLAPVTQLYVSLDAPNKPLLKKVDVPLFSDYWERLNQSLDYLAEKKQRTCIRLTCVKELNMIEPENYAKLIMKGNPDFIEVKAYMHVGASKERLERKNMPLHEEVVAFSKELMKYLSEYEIVSEHIPSRVLMMAKKSFKKNGKWFTWIDFEKFFTLQGNFTTEEYLKQTPSVGLSEKSLSVTPFVDEKTNEMEFWEDVQLKV
ncbi:4-demethylwyosine synthase TYW1 [Candidatus Woesearchaeota archaeon]|nr:MAG: 4-demethylwyosine synthase TYW1 [Candidatus Woesearchaeota archaeon]